MGDLKEINFDISYDSSDHNVAKDFWNPVLSRGNFYFRGIGYFSANGFSKLARGLSHFLDQDDYSIKFIIGEVSTEETKNILEQGNKLRTDKISMDWLEKHLTKRLGSIIETMDKTSRVPMDLIAHLIALDRLEIKYAVYNETELFHAKYGLVKDNYGNGIATKGSDNHSINSMGKSYEDFSVYTSWGTCEYYDDVEKKLNQIWDGKKKNIKVMDFPEAIKHNFFVKRCRDKNFTNITELNPKIVDDIYEGFEDEVEDEVKPKRPKKINGKTFNPLKHQKRAIEKWFKKDGSKGILEHATGSGKTITSIHAATTIFNKYEDEKLALVVSVPYRELVDQWEGELKKFNWSPIKCYMSQDSWFDTLQRNVENFESDLSSNLCIVVTNATLSNNSLFKQSIEKIDKNKLMFIGDECHHHSTEKIRENIPSAKYTLGLSATPLHWSNKDAADITLNIYNKISDEYTLEDAINDGVLCRFNYKANRVFLSEQEHEEYKNLTAELNKYIDSKTGKLRDEAAPILAKRGRIIQGCADKFITLRNLLKENGVEKYSLFYVGDGRINDDDLEDEEDCIRQLELVSEILEESNWNSHKFTYQEDKTLRRDILDNFKKGDLDSIVAIRCLDEGIDIPDCRNAYLIASTKNERQYIQRAGRVLRKSEGKERAKVFDFVVFPPSSTTETDKNLILSEVKRSKHFIDHSDNKDEVKKIINGWLKEYSIDEIDDLDFNPTD